MPDHLAQKTKAEIVQILQETIPDCISPDKSRSLSSCVKVFENPLFPENKTEVYNPNSYCSTPQSLRIIQTSYPLVILPQTMAQPPPTRMELIMATRYAPLVLLNPLNALPQGDYLKYLPKYTGEGNGRSVEEHLAAFYSYSDNHNIEQEDVWTRLLVQSLDGEACKWFRTLPAGSIIGIEALYEIFLKQWGDRKYYLYYITEFGALKRKNGESLADFTKRFNKVYQKIPVEVKPPETTTMITFANAFDSKFALWLRVSKPSTLIAMQEATIEVESNLLASNKLKAEEERGSKEKRKVKEEKLASTSKD